MSCVTKEKKKSAVNQIKSPNVVFSKCTSMV